jgi:hypothetical protein
LSEITNENLRKPLTEATLDKDWYWHNDIKIPNGVHVSIIEQNSARKEGGEMTIIRVRLDFYHGLLRG